MRFLFCCELYYPSIGGVQEVMRQIAERLVQRGHEVTVATSAIQERISNIHNNVRIEEFRISGNLVEGIEGEVDRYRRFVSGFGADAVLIKAAQQWAFDALWSVLPSIESRKIFIPCGFPGLKDETFENYYEKIFTALKSIDHFIFYSTQGRDIEFIKKAGYHNYSIIPNGACELEFEYKEPKSDLRRRLGVDASSFIFLTVGSLTTLKGHAETAEAFAKMDVNGASVTLIMNANRFHNGNIKKHGRLQKFRDLTVHSIYTFKKQGLLHTLRRVYDKLRNRGINNIEAKVRYWAKIANSQPGKNFFIIDLPREDLIDAFKTANLFVFASKVEYSPLVLFEAAAAGTPFLTVPVGNSEEIAQWTEAGLICIASYDNNGHTQVLPEKLSFEMKDAMSNPVKLKRLGNRGRENWQMQFTWGTISKQYEKVLCGGPTRGKSSRDE